MTWLELKIPPPIVALLCAIGMVYLPDLFALEAFVVPFQGWAAGLVIAFALTFDPLGPIEFRRHATTIPTVAAAHTTAHTTAQHVGAAFGTSVTPSPGLARRTAGAAR